MNRTDFPHDHHATPNDEPAAAEVDAPRVTSSERAAPEAVEALLRAWSLAAVMRSDERNPPVELRGGGPGGVVEWTGTLADFLVTRAGSTLWSSDTWQAIAALSHGPGSVYLCDGLCGPIVCLLRVA